MEAECSLFETSDMVANLLASITLLRDSWRLCCSANSPVSGSDSEGIVVDQFGPIGIMAFSAHQGLGLGLGPRMNHMVPLAATAGNGLFSELDRHGGDDQEPIMVHAGLWELFLGLYGSPNFQSQMKAVLEKSQSIILAGHSIGGAIASLTALWLLCYLQSIHSPIQVLCITFGSPLLGNKSLSKSLLRQRWAANFCHVVLQHDLVPRLLFAPLASMSAQLHFLPQYIQIQSSTAPQSKQVALQITDEVKNQLFGFVLGYTEAAAAAAAADHGSAGNVEGSSVSFWPFGNYLLCSEDGAICVDNAVSVVKLLYLMLATKNSGSCFEDHLKYGSCVDKVCFQFLVRKGFREGDLPNSSYEAGLALALESSGFASQESVYGQAKDCLKMAKQMGLTPNLNSAKLAIRLSKINPYRAQIEWYQSSCDDQMGYYDSFKHRQASKRDNQVNLFRIMLASFWDNVIKMIDNNELPNDFYQRRKWVCASHSYQLQVEPLDIAEYYRSGEHLRKGHYLKNGRERRHELFDKWWRERYFVEATSKRSRFASLTQDSCFWARVEEARELLEKVRIERNSSNLTQLWQGIDAFERYASELIEIKEVSIDVFAKNSSYSLWVEELRKLRSRVQQFHQFPGILGGEMVP